MNEEDRGTIRTDECAYWRRYLDENAWEPVDAGTVRRALGDEYRDVSLALEFLREAGKIRTPAAMYEARRV